MSNFDHKTYDEFITSHPEYKPLCSEQEYAIMMYKIGERRMVWRDLCPLVNNKLKNMIHQVFDYDNSYARNFDIMSEINKIPAKFIEEYPGLYQPTEINDLKMDFKKIVNNFMMDLYHLKKENVFSMKL